jgi:L-ascorbate metabolism protein UlaG (beta-lactamase superfamily)
MSASIDAGDGMLNRRSFVARGAATLGAGAVGLHALASIGSAEPQGAPSAGELRIQRLSWAGVKLELGSRTLLIDAWTDSAIWGPSWTEPVVPVQVSTPTCSALITHLHNDHFDPPLLKTALGANGFVICEREMASAVVSRDLRVREVPLFHPFAIADFTVTPVTAVDGVGAAQVAWVISGGGKRIIHCGDGVFHGALWNIGRQFGPFDLAFVPINGADLLQLRPPAGVPLSATPEQGAAMARVLGAKLVCPIHYGFNDPATYREHPNALPSFLEAAQRRGVEVEVAKPGEWITWRPRT